MVSELQSKKNLYDAKRFNNEMLELRICLSELIEMTDHQWVFYKLQRNPILSLLFGANAQSHELFRCIKCNAIWCEDDKEYIMGNDECIIRVKS
jgi:hypothetical protein